MIIQLHHRAKQAALTVLGLIIAVVIILAIASGTVYVAKKIAQKLEKLFPRGYDPADQFYSIQQLNSTDYMNADYTLPYLPAGPPGTLPMIIQPKEYAIEWSPLATGPWFPCWDETVDATPAEAQNILRHMRDFDLDTGATNASMFWRARVVAD